MTTERMEVQRTIAADPAAIFGVLRDPHGHVSIDASGMLMDASGEPASKVGDSFTIHMDREALNDFPLGKYDVTIIITKYEPDREIAWTIEGVIKPPIRHVYGYTLEPTEGGTLVTLVLRLVGVQRRDEGDLPDHPRERAPGHARDPRPQRREGRATTGHVDTVKPVDDRERSSETYADMSMRLRASGLDHALELSQPSGPPLCAWLVGLLGHSWNVRRWRPTSSRIASMYTSLRIMYDRDSFGSR